MKRFPIREARIEIAERQFGECHISRAISVRIGRSGLEISNLELESKSLVGLQGLYLLDSSQDCSNNMHAFACNAKIEYPVSAAFAKNHCTVDVDVVSAMRET